VLPGLVRRRREEAADIRASQPVERTSLLQDFLMAQR
jgi:hypothetical protein